MCGDTLEDSGEGQGRQASTRVPVLIPAVDEQVLRELRMVAVNVEPKMGGVLMKELSTAAPFQGLFHLKRIRRETGPQGVTLTVLLCPAPAPAPGQPPPLAPGGGGADAADGPVGPLPEAVEALVRRHGLRPFTVAVPAEPPATKELWEDWNRLWPIGFHPVSDPLLRPPDPLSPAEAEAMRRGMRLALADARSAAAEGLPRNAAVIVDPTTGAVVASGRDLSRCPRGGAAHPLKHAAVSAVDAAAARDLALFPADPVTGHATAAAPSAAAPSAAPLTDSEVHDLAGGKRKRDGALSEEAAQRPYLCTGWDCFVVREPCVFCAMALVHSRVRRVVFCEPGGRGGALGGRLKLHGVRSLNHHYTVYSVSEAAAEMEEEGAGTCSA